MKILVIEDDYDIRHILREILSSAGYEVTTAADGEEGLRRVRAERPALVITDILMPGLDGFQLLNEIRKDDTLRDLQVIFYTGNYLDKEDEQLAYDLGVSRFLLKPMPPADICAVVKEILDEKTKSAIPTETSGYLDEPTFLKLHNERLVTKLKHKALENDNALNALQNIMESIADGVVVINRDYTILQANSKVASLAGIEKAEIIGRKCYEISYQRSTPCEGPNIICPHYRIFQRGENIVKVLHTHVDAQGNERHVEITASPIKDGKGRIFAMVETHRDIMEKYSDDELVKLVKKLNDAQTHLKHMAITDDLTGLRNRRYIIERLEEEFQRTKRSGGSLGLIMLDIDHFKNINDVHGHLFGDVVLRVISARIKSSLRKHDIVGRIGGEEFLVICPDSSIEDTVIVAQRIRNLIYEDLIGDGVKEARVALSAGVTVLLEGDLSAEKLFSRADIALYRAKEQGRNRVVVV
jgi:diguanylate cyclase (GGDEF)-like protein/PAS domain S-box-containing protein